MFDLNRLYLEIHQHVEDENFEALAADGARLSALVKELRPMNPAPDFQAPLDRLAKASQAVTVAGRQHDPELGRKALADMGRSCTACHRVYR